MKTLLLLLALASVCYGRIGETLEECRKRYGHEIKHIDGKEQNIVGNVYHFHKAGIRVIVAFSLREDKAGAIAYSYYFNDDLKGFVLGKKHIQVMLEANSRSKNWRFRGDRVMENLDSGLTAQLSEDGTELGIESLDFRMTQPMLRRMREKGTIR